MKARSLLALWSKNGWLQRIRPGVYLPVELAAESSNEVMVDPWVVATQLFSPCYIGGWSACEYCGFTDQIFSSIVVLTAMRVNGKEQMAGKMTFLIKKQDSEKMFGLKTVWKESPKSKFQTLIKQSSISLMIPRLEEEFASSLICSKNVFTRNI